MKTLQELTGRESGLVLYDTGHSYEGVCLNWSDINGLPRLDPMGFGFIGLGEDIPEIESVYSEDIFCFLNNAKFWMRSDTDTVIPAGGQVYRLIMPAGDVFVIAPDGWA
jgi:hypothetical protein